MFDRLYNGHAGASERTKCCAARLATKDMAGICFPIGGSDNFPLLVTFAVR